LGHARRPSALAPNPCWLLSGGLSLATPLDPRIAFPRAPPYVHVSVSVSDGDSDSDSDSDSAQRQRQRQRQRPASVSVPVIYGQAPSCFSDTPAAPAEHAFAYVFPSQPHTGL